MLLLYSFGIRLYFLFGFFLKFRNDKIRKWYYGNKNKVAPVLPKSGNKKIIWFHISSLGEYEQAKPVIKRLYKKFDIVITFFSPSGFEHKSVREFTQNVFYLGKDTAQMARQNIDHIKPDYFILVKYDFWLNHLFQLEKENIKSIVISGLFRPNQIFFKPWGNIFRKGLRTFDHIFLQNQSSKELLAGIGITKISVNGDTRVDSVLENVPAALDKLPQIVKDFAKGHKCLVVGSSYKAEEQIVLKNLDTCLIGWKVLIAPHNLNKKHLKELEISFGSTASFLSKTNDLASHTQVLIIDQIGLLKYLYAVADVAFVGGGFGKTVHNTLEPAAFGIPLLFGPNFSKFPEAVEFVNKKGAFTVSTEYEFKTCIKELMRSDVQLKAKNTIKEYINSNRNSIDSILMYILSKKII
ncbi:MAG: 3-deoxy-D-manno-octulosonic acid transferase [Bacteroidia bacterium]